MHGKEALDLGYIDIERLKRNGNNLMREMRERSTDGGTREIGERKRSGREIRERRG